MTWYDQDAGGQSSSQATWVAAVIRPTWIADACRVTMATSGSATAVTWSPRRLTVEAVQ
ncbi:hypothetical protein ACFV0O_18275 [Kitasatospora sp. NPDC059577]|uniref:hypothetical protein n=1 Tax=Kitasatospora sp. NPDC059577 TaxID=3346873 RepID=UPI0036C4B9BB